MTNGNQNQLYQRVSGGRVEPIAKAVTPVTTQEQEKRDLTVEQQIAEQRRSTLESRKAISPAIIKRELGIDLRQQRFVRESRRAAGAELTKSEKDFERQVARQAPEQARTEYLEEAYQEALSIIQPKVNSLKSQIESYQENINKIRSNAERTRSDRDRIETYEDNIRELQSELNTYEGALSSNKIYLVGKHFSGELKATADYARSKAEASTQRSEARKSFISKQKKEGNLIVYDKFNQIVGSIPKENQGIIKEQYSYYIKDGKIAQTNLDRISQLETLKYEGQIKNLERQGWKFNKGTEGQIISFTSPDTGKLVHTSFDAYQKEVDKLQQKIPEKYYQDPSTGKLLSKEEYFKLDPMQFRTGLYSEVYKTKTGKVINQEDLIEYYKENKIPYQLSKPVELQYGIDLSKGAKISMKEVPIKEKIEPITYTEKVIKGFEQTPFGQIYPAFKALYERKVQPVIEEISPNVQKFYEKIINYIGQDPNTYLNTKDAYRDTQAWYNALEKDLINKYPEYAEDYKRIFNKVRIEVRPWDTIVAGPLVPRKYEVTITDISKELQNQTRNIPIIGPEAAKIIDLLTPKTPAQFALMLAPVSLYKAGVLGSVFTKALVFQKPLAEIGGKVYEKIPAKFGYFKGLTGAILAARFPTVGTAVGIEQTKMFIKDPKQYLIELEKYFRLHPWEGLGLLTGGLALKYAEYGLSKYKVPTRKVELPKYGEVIIQKVPKYGEVVWVKGIFSQTEKLNIMDQIVRLEGPGKRIFVQVSPEGIALKAFSNRSGAGFEVSEISNPMRGLYEAPPAKFLEKYYSITKTNAMAASYYASLSRERFTLDPIKYIKKILTGAEPTTQRSFEYLRRTYKGIETPNWIKKATNALLNNKSIPKESLKLINKYWKNFLERPIEWNNKIYVGEAKAQLLNSINLRNRGNNFKLKYYSALLEYQNQMKVQLAGGAENLSGILPFGPESQVVTAIGTRFFAKGLSDLRKAKITTPTSKILEFILGSKRGEARALIEGELVELQPVRAFPGKAKIETFKGKQILTKASQVLESDIIKGIRRERISTSIKPLEPIPLKERKDLRQELPRELFRRIETRRITERLPFRRTDERDLIRDLIRRPEIREPRRPEIRRIEFRLTSRREILREPQREIIRREPRKEIIRRDIRRPDERLIKIPTTIPKKKKESEFDLIKKIKKEIIKPRRFVLTPTVTQRIYKLKRRKPILLSKITGFEAIRV